jgi:hypothetical protein
MCVWGKQATDRRLQASSLNICESGRARRTNREAPWEITRKQKPLPWHIFQIIEISQSPSLVLGATREEKRNTALMPLWHSSFSRDT